MMGNLNRQHFLPIPSYTEDNDALRRDYPNCKHGLVIALNNADVNGTKVAPFANSRDFFYGSWFTTDEDWMGKFISSETRDPLPGYWVITMRY